MQKFITTIEGLKETVRVNRSESMFASLLPYLDDAFDRYVRPYLGDALADRLTDPAAGEAERRVAAMVCRALGPLAVAMAGPELGILIGDSGHTVTRTDKVTVASDEKIARAMAGMRERGWANMERLVDYLVERAEEFPEWEECRYRRDLSAGRYLNGAREFQDWGKVNIGYSRLTFEAFRPLLDRLEITMRRRLGASLDDRLREEMRNPSDPVLTELVGYARLWLAASVACLHTSQATLERLSGQGGAEFRPFIHPLFEDVTDTGNYYAAQVRELDTIITDLMLRHASELGLPEAVRNDFNSIDKHIFVL